jgi:hypothetical protein
VASGASNITVFVPVTSIAGLPPRSCDRRVLRRKPFVLDKLTKLRERDRVSGAQTNLHDRAFERDIDRFDAGQLLNGHAHGVGTHRSIHPQYFQIDAPQIGERRRWEQ